MLLVKVSDFRRNLKRYLELSLKEEIVVQQGKNLFDINLRSAKSSDSYFDCPKNIAHIKEGVEDVKEGRYITLTFDEIKNLLEI